MEEQFEQQLEAFGQYLRQIKKSENTISSYMRDLRGFFLYLEEIRIERIEQVNQTNVMSYVYELQNQNKSSATIVRGMAAIRAYFYFAIQQGIVTQNPVIQLHVQKQERMLPKSMTIEQIEQLLSQPDQQKPRGIRDKAMLELLYATGMRVSELVSLKISDVDIVVGFVHCHNGEKERTIPMGRQAKVALEIYLSKVRNQLLHDDTQTTLFLNYGGKPMTRQGFWKIVKKYVEQAGLSHDVTAHSLRQSFAVHLLENGADVKAVQEMMGHCDVATTQSYMRKKEQKLRSVYAHTHPRA